MDEEATAIIDEVIRIYEYEHHIRDVVNDGYIWSYNNNNDDDEYIWSKICSCMDWTQETQFAIDYYISDNDESMDDSHSKFVLHHIGVLQSVVIQHDIIDNLRNCVGLKPFNKKSKSKGIRKELNEIRLLISGHPTEIKSLRASKNAILYSSLGRPQKHGVLKYSTYFENVNPPSFDGVLNSRNTINVIDLFPLLRKQGSWFSLHLRIILKHMVSRENEWRTQMNERDLLQEIKQLSYLVSRFKDRPFHADLIRSELIKIVKLIDDLKKESSGLSEHVDSIEMALNFYSQNQHSDNCDEVIHIVLNHEVSELRKALIDIQGQLNEGYIVTDD